MSEDMLNIMGSFISTELDAFENLHKELEEKDKEIERLNNIINEAIELTNKIIEVGWDYDEKDTLAIKLEEILNKAN